MTGSEILVVGSLAFDDIETPAGRREGCLGGSANYFSVGASLYTPVRAVAVVGEDFPDEYMSQLGHRGVDTSGVTRVAGRTFRWKGTYPAEDADAVTLATELNVFERFDPRLPDNFRDSPWVFLGNIHPDLQASVLEQLSSAKMVGADTMNFWIEGQREALCRLLPRLDLLVINETEAKLLAGEKNIYLAAKAIRGMGPRVLIVKRGGYGSLLFHPDGFFTAPAYPLEQVRDPTGAGDTFASGVMSSLAQSGETGLAAFKRAVVRGTVIASFTCEGFGLERLWELSPEDVDRRSMDFMDMMKVK